MGFATERRASRAMLSKVPEVTVYFWIIKIMATTVGETAADLLAIRLELGLTVTSVVLTLLFIAVLIWQMKLQSYVAPVYWLTVVLISVVGTLISDNLVDGFGVDLVTTSILFSICLAVTFAWWYWSEGTLSIHSIVTTRREAFYWAAILFTFAMGTSVGDLLAERLELGYLQAAIVFALAIALVAGISYVHRAGAILCFWIAYILTRPLGASIGDWMAKPVIADGLGLGTVTTSLIFLSIIFLIVVYLSITKADRPLGQPVE